MLSAKSEQQLKSYAQEMKRWIQAHSGLVLSDIAFTLQVGRQAMDYRLAILASSREVLLQRLEEFVENRALTSVYTARVKKGTSDATLFEEDSDGRALLHIWCQKRNLEKIAQVWVRGVNIDWMLLYAIGEGSSQGTIPTAPALPHRISLPTYPFARERYWIPTPTVGNGGVGLAPAQGSCPLSTTRLLTPSWKEEPLGGQGQALPTEELPPVAANPLVLLCDLPDTLASRIQSRMVSGGICRGLKVKNWYGEQSRREQCFQDAVVQLIQELQQLLQSRPAGPLLVQVVVAHRGEPSFLEGLAGVLKTAQLEYPRLRGQMIEVDGEPAEEELLVWLRENQLLSLKEPHIRYRDGKRWVVQWREHPQETTPTTIPWKEGGCYLITGGAGGLARLFVQEMAKQVQEATVILVGRSALSQEALTHLELAGRLGLHIDYQQVDVGGVPSATGESAVHTLIQIVLRQYGHLDGIIHAAGVLRDSLLLNKTPAQVHEVLAPKVVGVERLDEESRQIPLDFFVLCSSGAAVMGNVGQADYAAANAYLDAFAHARRAQVLLRERQGETLSINWPYWQEGGMQIEAATQLTMQQRMGGEAMETETGMKALYQALALRQAQVMVVHGQIERLKQFWQGQPAVKTQGFMPEPLTTASDREAGQEPGPVSLERFHEVLKRIVSDLIKVRVEEIDVQTPLSEYGFDSITFTQFANRLNQTYQLDLTPAHFYEHSTLEHLALSLLRTSVALLAPHFATASPLASEMTQKDQVLAAAPAPRENALVAHWPVWEQSAPAVAPPIAIIGMSGRFPQAPDRESLWRNLLAGRDCISTIPPSRWDWQTYFGNPATEANKTNVKWAGILEGTELFDPLFFGISPREAEQMDPQQRLLMMYVWKAIEDAGYAASSLSGTNTALFVGTASSGYGERVLRSKVLIEGYSAIGLAPTMGPNRMSYFLNLHGPSEPIDTACSSSLVAIHRGVSAIESGQCNMAIVGGVNTLVSPELHISASKAGMLSSDGCCKTFSAQANGYVRGEGVGMLVLKKLDLAEQAGDHIYAVIRGSFENHGGRASSLTAPNPRAQADLLIAAYRKAGIDPRTVGYIEAHGSGTELGDPIEVNGLKTAFSELAWTGARYSPCSSESSVSQAWCGIGTVKSNIGHLELAAGVAGVIKVLLQMQHKKLVKSLHCEQINPYIQLEGSPFYIVQENREWEAVRDRAGKALPRRAGVSSFGVGGTNAHVVLEEYVPKSQGSQSRSLARWSPSGQALGRGQAPALLVLSAKNEERLHEQVRQLLAWVQLGMQDEEPLGQAQDRREAQSLQDLAYTLQVGREAMEERLALQVSSLAELEEQLCRFLQEPKEGGNWYRGHVKQHKETVTLLSADEELQEAMQEAIEKWLQSGKYEKLLEWWVKGLRIEWSRLYREHLPRRISLPTYPFAQERYWLDVHKPIFADKLAQLTQNQPPTFYAGSEDLENNIAPLNELEQRIANIWQNMLGIETVRVCDNFFDLGGNSLLATRLITQIRQEFGIGLPLRALFETANVSELAQIIEQVRQEGISI